MPSSTGKVSCWLKKDVQAAQGDTALMYALKHSHAAKQAFPHQRFAFHGLRVSEYFFCLFLFFIEISRKAKTNDTYGVPHDKTTHHFRLYAEGGGIEVIANDSKDDENIQAIRSHLKHITAMFYEGDFSTPMFIHDQVPPGISVMKEKRAQISYSFEELARGGRVQIKTADPDSLKAVHEFLHFQIRDHHTGDSADIASQ